MIRIQTAMIGLLVTVLLCFSGSTALANSDIIPPSDPDTVPEMAETGYITYSSSVDFPLSQKAVSGWIYEGFKILAARGRTNHFDKPVDTVQLAGTWAEEGAVRRIEYADGHFSLEKAIEAQTYYFKSLNWDMTRPDRQGADYTVIEYRLEPLSDDTSRFTWTLHIMPNEDYASMGTQRVVEQGVEQWMDDTLYQMFSMASSDFGYDINWDG